jgi:hypothetical protein
MNLMTSPDYPLDFSEGSTHVTTVPIYMRLREHHCVSPQKPIGCGGLRNNFDDGLQNAYFPPAVMQENTVRQISVFRYFICSQPHSRVV